MPKKSPAAAHSPAPNHLPEHVELRATSLLALEAVRLMRAYQRARQGARCTPDGPNIPDLYAVGSNLTAAGSALIRLHANPLMKRPAPPEPGKPIVVSPALAELHAAFFAVWNQSHPVWNQPGWVPDVALISPDIIDRLEAAAQDALALADELQAPDAGEVSDSPQWSKPTTRSHLAKLYNISTTTLRRWSQDGRVRLLERSRQSVSIDLRDAPDNVRRRLGPDAPKA
jgi:hypothetical protein